MRNIFITVDSDGRVTTDTKQLGYSGEHNAVQLVVEFSVTDESFSASDYFRIIVDGRYSEALYLSDGALLYSVPQESMCPPRVQCQVVGYREGEQAPEVIMKSQVFGFDVDRSETATEAVTNTPDVFERALEACKKASDDAACAGNYADEAAKYAENAKFQRANAALSSISAGQSAESAAKSAEVVAQAEFELNNICNALKGSGTGSEVNLSDVSPLSHTVSVKVSGVESTGETLTKTETVSSQGATVMLDTPATSVRAVISGGAYCIAGIIPTVDGDDLTALSDFSALEIVPHGSYAEIGAIYDIVYTVEGNVLSWVGSWTYSDDSWGDEATEVSGSYTLSSSGQQITGFYQVYALDETNPHYIESDTEYMDINAEISLYEGKAVVVTVQGKNYFDVSRVVSSPNITKAGVINDGNGTLTITTKSATSVTAGEPYTLRDYAPDLKVGETYTLSAVSPLPEGMTSSYTSNYIYLTVYENSWKFGESKKITETMLDSQVLWYVWGKNNAITTVSNIQIEKGSTATEYEPYKEPVTYKANSDGTVEGVESIYPSMALTTDTEGAELEVEYNRDINKAFAELQAAIVSMGGNV